jgi:acetyl-CoA carboxylase carboxyltransferase component
MPEGNAKPYDIRDIIERVVDKSDTVDTESSFDEFKQDYGKTIVCGYARLKVGLLVLLPIND